MYKVRAKNVLGSTYPTFSGSFQINLTVSGQPSNNTSLYKGQTTSGSHSSADIDIFTFNATAADNLVVTMTPGSGFFAECDGQLLLS
jgi:hypothetical protein